MGLRMRVDASMDCRHRLLPNCRKSSRASKERLWALSSSAKKEVFSLRVLGELAHPLLVNIILWYLTNIFPVVFVGEGIHYERLNTELWPDYTERKFYMFVSLSLLHVRVLIRVQSCFWFLQTIYGGLAKYFFNFLVNWRNIYPFFTPPFFLSPL